jgi:ribulose-phosphate 3-epimerase
MKPIISASILSADFGHLEDQIRQCESAGVDWIHIDVMDGHFVPNITMGPFIVETCKRITSLPLDVHLMIEKPERHLKSFADAGANSITVQTETCPHLFRTLQNIHELGCKAGVALNPSTTPDVLNYVTSQADLILVMTVNPGYSGQKFIPEMVNKVSQVKNVIDQSNPDIFLQVDGGISPVTLSEVYQAGAGVFVVSTAIFKNPQGIMDGVVRLRHAMN